MDAVWRGALELAETDYSQDETFAQGATFPIVWVLTEALISLASMVTQSAQGLEHVLYAILHDGNALATRI